MCFRTQRDRLLGLSGSDNGVSYQLLQGGNPYGSAVSGTGSALNWTNLPAGTYTVQAGGSTLMNGSAIVTMISAPAAPTVSVTQPTCSDFYGYVAITSGTTVLLSVRNGINYYAYTGPYTVAANTGYNITAENSNSCVSITATTGTMGAQPQTPAAPT